MKPYRAEILCIVLVAALAASPFTRPAAAQETRAENEPGGHAQRIVEVQHADPDQLAKVLRVFRVGVRSHAEMGLITIEGGPADVAAAAEAAARLDVPPEPTRSIELTAYILGASKSRDLQGSVPPALEEVARQLREVFGYRSVDLVDVLLLRVRDRGEGMVRGVLSGPAEGVPYRLGLNKAFLADGADGGAVRIDGLIFEASTPSDGRVEPGEAEDAQTPYHKGFLTTLVTDVDVQVGQKAVVGKAATSGMREGLILVLEARILD